LGTVFLILKFKQFLDRTNALALVLGILAGSAVNRSFTAFLDDLLKPLLAFMFSIGNWSEAQLVLSRTIDVSGKVTTITVKFGHLLGVLFDLAITACVVLLAARLLRQGVAAKAQQPPAVCPNCAASVSSSPTTGEPGQLDFSPANNIDRFGTLSTGTAPESNSRQ